MINKIESKIVAKIPLTIGSASLSYKTNSLNYGSISRLSESNTTSSSGKNSEYTDAKLELIMEDKKIFTTIQDTDKKVELLESSINSIENYRTQKLMDGGSLYDIVDDKAFIPNIFKKAFRFRSSKN